MDKPSYNRHFTSYYDDYDYDRDQDRRRGDRQIGEEGNDTGHAGSLRAAAPAGIGTIRFGAILPPHHEVLLFVVSLRLVRRASVNTGSSDLAGGYRIRGAWSRGPPVKPEDDGVRKECARHNQANFFVIPGRAAGVNPGPTP